MRTAHEAFLASPHRAAFEKIAETDTFDVATEYALLEFAEMTGVQVADPNAAMALHYELVGANLVLEILKKLHLKQEPQKTVQMPSLKPPQ